VGNKSDATKFTVHKAFLTYESPFFEAAFNGKFKEGKTQVIELEDVYPDEFNLLVTWVYERQVALKIGNSADLLVAARLWNLAERCLMPTLQNTAMEIIWTFISGWYLCWLGDEIESVDESELYSWAPPEEFIRLAYSTKLEGTPLKRLVVDKFAWQTDTNVMKECCQQVPREVGMDVLVELHRNKGKGRNMIGMWYVRPSKNYYVRGEDVDSMPGSEFIHQSSDSDSE